VERTAADPDLAALCIVEHPRLVGMLTLFLGERQVAEDIAQEALIRLHQHWPRVRSSPSPHAWLTTVALNLGRSWWRRRYAELRANRRVATRPAVPEPTDPADVMALRDAVTALPPRQRAVVVLRFYSGLSVAETADALGCPTGTVKSLTHLAIASLRQILVLDIPEELTHA
jgi:RNA polymerase sigma-70 factor (sigma-E family)